MELDPSQYAALRHERYAQWEKASPMTCVVLGVAAVISAATLHPNPLAAALNFLSGLVIFYCWRAALRERFNTTLALALLGILLALSEPVLDASAPIQLQFAKGAPWLGFGLFLGIFVFRRRGRRHAA